MRTPMAKKKKSGKWIQKAIKHPGALTEKAKKVGMTVAQYEKKVLSKKSKASATTKREANLARTLNKLRKKKGRRK